MKIITLKLTKITSATSVYYDIGRSLHPTNPDPLVDLVYRFVNSRIRSAETTLLHIYANHVGITFKIKYFLTRVFKCTMYYFVKDKKSR